MNRCCGGIFLLQMDGRGDFFNPNIDLAIVESECSIHYFSTHCCGGNFSLKSDEWDNFFNLSINVVIAEFECCIHFFRCLRYAIIKNEFVLYIIRIRQTMYFRRTAENFASLPSVLIIHSSIFPIGPTAIISEPLEKHTFTIRDRTETVLLYGPYIRQLRRRSIIFNGSFSRACDNLRIWKKPKICLLKSWRTDPWCTGCRFRYPSLNLP